MGMNLLGLTKYVDRIPNQEVKKHVLDLALNLAVPFNRWLGFHIQELGPEKVVVVSPPRTLRQNHLGGAHACALALLGEYPAGILLSQNFSPEEFRIIISKLEVEYHKQGRGSVTGVAVSPQVWPQIVDGEVFIDLKTHITNEKNELVALVSTKWQLKEWGRVRVKS